MSSKLAKVLLALFAATGVDGTSMTCACQDPHLTLAHGGRTDFRGKHNQLYNFLSAKNVSVNVKIEESTFKLDQLTVHGTFMTEAHLALRTDKGRMFNVSFFTHELNEFGWSWRAVNGTCSAAPVEDAAVPRRLADLDRPAARRRGRRFRLAQLSKRLLQQKTADASASGPFTLAPHKEKTCDNLRVTTDVSSVEIETTEWILRLRGSHVPSRISGPKKRLDLSFLQKVADEAFAVRPHGIIGQSFDGDGIARRGALDAYPPRNQPVEFTTRAMAEGAIDGVAKDYEMPSHFTTAFPYSRFDAKETDKPANVTLGARRSASATDITDEDMRDFDAQYSSNVGRRLQCACPVACCADTDNGATSWAGFDCSSFTQSKCEDRTSHHDPISGASPLLGGPQPLTTILMHGASSLAGQTVSTSQVHPLTGPSGEQYIVNYYDDLDFSAWMMCCACGGGDNPGSPACTP